MKRKVIDRCTGSGPASFDLEDSTRRAMTHYRAVTQGRGGKVDVGRAAHQRARLAKAQANLVEIKQKARGRIGRRCRGRAYLGRRAAHGAGRRARGAEPVRKTLAASDGA